MPGAALGGLLGGTWGQGSPEVCGTAQGITLPFCARLRALPRPPGASMPCCSERDHARCLLIQLKVGSAGTTVRNAWAGMRQEARTRGSQRAAASPLLTRAQFHFGPSKSRQVSLSGQWEQPPGWGNLCFSPTGFILQVPSGTTTLPIQVPKDGYASGDTAWCSFWKPRGHWGNAELSSNVECARTTWKKVPLHTHTESVFWFPLVCYSRLEDARRGDFKEINVFYHVWAILKKCVHLSYWATPGTQITATRVQKYLKIHFLSGFGGPAFVTRFRGRKQRGGWPNSPLPGGSASTSLGCLAVERCEDKGERQVRRARSRSLPRPLAGGRRPFSRPNGQPTAPGAGSTSETPTPGPCVRQSRKVPLSVSLSVSLSGPAPPAPPSAPRTSGGSSCARACARRGGAGAAPAHTHGAGAAPRHWRSGASVPPPRGADGPAIGRAGRRCLPVGCDGAVGGAAPSPWGAGGPRPPPPPPVPGPRGRSRGGRWRKCGGEPGPGRAPLPSGMGPACGVGPAARPGPAGTTQPPPRPEQPRFGAGLRRAGTGRRPGARPSAPQGGALTPGCRSRRASRGPGRFSGERCQGKPLRCRWFRVFPLAGVRAVQKGCEGRGRGPRRLRLCLACEGGFPVPVPGRWKAISASASGPERV